MDDRRYLPQTMLKKRNRVGDLARAGDRAVRHPSLVGTLTLVASDAGLAAILWPADRLPRRRPPPLLDETRRQLDAYFTRTLARFDLPLDPRGTPFQRRVWEALATIPFGEARSYRQVALQLDQPTATRAVGAANGRNPLSIVLPCHRVIGSDGALIGFAGGLAAKRFRLAHEGIAPPTLF